ncbi:MAG: hypothetical protein LBL83_01820 [Clostridiales bacterium]|jgi:hypothetical protein|nr:hypothetical protein [Clostridiales bacterium]
MIIVQKTPGPAIEYEISGTKIAFADGELTLNLAKCERDDPVHIDICVSKLGGMLVTGAIPGVADKYAAEIDIPARKYAGAAAPSGDGGGEDGAERAPAPFDMGACALYLWGLED